MEQWSVTDVAEWVATQTGGDRNVAEAFRREKIDGEVLAEVPQMPFNERVQFLQRLGFAELGPMTKFVMEIEKLGKRKQFELASAGSFRDYKVLIGYFLDPSWALATHLRSLTIPELESNGFQVLVRDTMDEFTRALRVERVHAAWIFSGCAANVVGGSVAEFVAEVRRFHQAGRGLMLWGGGDPFFAHANHVLGDLFNFELTGHGRGGKELFPGNPNEPGNFDPDLKLCAGIECLYEGNTICYPSEVPPGWKVFATSSNETPALLAKEASSEAPGTLGTGRVIVDTGFRKLYGNCWTAAGTARYVSNCAAWLVLRERFRLPGLEFE